MNVFAKNLEILLMHHDLVMVPGLGGFLANYKQAEFENEDSNTVIPPSRTIVFNKDLKANDGLMVHSYMQTYDATYPQAIRQLELDVENINEHLNENGWVIIENIGTLHVNLEGHVTMEQMHKSVITPALFALPPIQVSSVDEIQHILNIKTAIEQTSMLPIAQDEEQNYGKIVSIRRRWRDIAISSAAAVALFFLFAFPAFKDSADKQYVAGPSLASKQLNESVVKQNDALQGESTDIKKESDQKTITPTTQIILLQAPQTGQGTVVISPQQFDQSNSVTNPNGNFTIVVTVAANEQCAQSLIKKLNRQNLPGAFYYSDGKIEYVLYSRFATYDDANNTLEALRQVNKRFKKSWIMNLNKENDN